MTDIAITTLRAKLGQLPARDLPFAQSLLDQYQKRGSLSDRQWPYVAKLIEKASTPAPAPAPKADASALYQMFDKAAERLKRPRLTFEVDGREITVSPAGAGSKNAGMLYVKLNGEYAGKLDRDGEVKVAFGVHPKTATSIAAMINRFANDPVSAATAYGHATGNCCFCGKELTDSRSVDVGYGPTCASNWGLPWGE